MRHAMPGGIALTLESAKVSGGDSERAVVEELAHGLDRLADIAAELGGGVAQDVDAGGRETGQAEIATEAAVEGGAGNAGRPCARLPEGLGGMHGREVLADIGERSPYRSEGGTGQFAAAAHTALAEVAIEGGGIVEGDIAGCEVDDLRSASGCEVDDLGSASGCEDESEDDGEVTSALDGVGDDLEELLNLCSGEAAWCAGARLGAFHRIAGIGFEDIHADEELEEGRDAGETGADGYGGRFAPGEADAMSEGEDILRRDLIGRLMEATEEEAESAVVGVRGCGGSLSGAASRRGRRRGSLPRWS